MIKNIIWLVLKHLAFVSVLFFLLVAVPVLGTVRPLEGEKHEYEISKKPEEAELERLEKDWEKNAGDFSNLEGDEERKKELDEILKESVALVQKVTNQVLDNFAKENDTQFISNIQLLPKDPNILKNYNANYESYASTEEGEVEKTKENDINTRISTVFGNLEIQSRGAREFHLLNFEKNILHIAGDGGSSEGIFILTQMALLNMPGNSFPSKDAENLGKKYGDLYKSYTSEEFWSQFSDRLCVANSPTVGDIIIHLEYVKKLGWISEVYQYASIQEKMEYVQLLVNFYNSSRGSLPETIKKVVEFAKTLPRSFQADILQKAMGEILWQEREVKITSMGRKSKRKIQELSTIPEDIRTKAKTLEQASINSNKKNIEDHVKKRRAEEISDSFNKSLEAFEIKENSDPNDVASEFLDTVGQFYDKRSKSYQVTAYVKLKPGYEINGKQHLFATLGNAANRVRKTANKVDAAVLTRKTLKANGNNVDHTHAEMLIVRELGERYFRDLTDWPDLSNVIDGDIGVSKSICAECSKALKKVKIVSTQKTSGKTKYWDPPFPNLNLLLDLMNFANEPSPPAADFMDLLTAAENGDYVTVESLLLNGASPNPQNASGMTPLLIALDYLHDDVADLIIGLGADVLIADNLDQSPINYAAKYLLENAFYHLCNMGLSKKDVDNQDCQIGYSALHWAAENHHANLIECLVDLGANIDISAYEGGDTPLHITTRNNDIENTNLLLSYGADPNIKNNVGETPLELMIKNNLLGSLLLDLESEKSKINIKIAKEIAQQQDQKDIIELLNYF